jgi:hypothetical protein
MHRLLPLKEQPMLRSTGRQRVDEQFLTGSPAPAAA